MLKIKGKSEFNKEALEYLIEDWHWDKKSHEFARKMGLFMLGFFEHLENQNLSGSTRRKHERNCSLIGKFVADYGYHDEFTPKILTSKPGYISEFKRKVMNTNSMVESYKTTWRKLAKYASLQIKKNA